MRCRWKFKCGTVKEKRTEADAADASFTSPAENSLQKTTESPSQRTDGIQEGLVHVEQGDHCSEDDVKSGATHETVGEHQSMQHPDSPNRVQTLQEHAREQQVEIRQRAPVSSCPAPISTLHVVKPQNLRQLTGSGTHGGTVAGSRYQSRDGGSSTVLPARTPSQRLAATEDMESDRVLMTTVEGGRDYRFKPVGDDATVQGSRKVARRSCLKQATKGVVGWSAEGWTAECLLRLWRLLKESQKRGHMETLRQIAVYPLHGRAMPDIQELHRQQSAQNYDSTTRVLRAMPTAHELSACSDEEIEQLSRLQELAAIAYRQFVLLPDSVRSDADAAEIILESSFVEHYLMLPWSPMNEHVRANFYYDVPPMAVDDPAFAPQGDGGRHTAIRRTLTDGAVASYLSVTTPPAGAPCYPPNPGMARGATTESGWSADNFWTDPSGHMSLSKKQLDKIHQWVRISELPAFRESPKRRTLQDERRAAATSFHLGGTNVDEEISKLRIVEKEPSSAVIRQGFVGDCSFLSSLAVLADYEARFCIPIVTSILHPRVVGKDGRSQPVINLRGMYGCRLFFNGVPRMILVDDFLPVRVDGRLLAAHSSRKKEMWVSLLEKAFVKLMGGSYYMHGSNPAADLYHLTGWIPETIPFRSDIHTGAPNQRPPIVTGMGSSLQHLRNPHWNATWRSLYDGLRSGRCVACLGTSEVYDAAPSNIEDFPEGVSVSSGIVARHAYSILDFDELTTDSGEVLRLLYLKNPWGVVQWKGAFGPTDVKRWTPELQRRLQYNQSTYAQTDTGTFWIQWHDVVHWFSHLYICWSVAFYKYTTEIHASWVVTPPIRYSLLSDDSHVVAFNPQFHLQLFPEGYDAETLQHLNLRGDPSDEVEVWILLSRHIVERKRTTNQKYIALHIHLGSERVTCPSPPDKHGIYSNGECALVKVKICPFATPPTKDEQLVAPTAEEPLTAVLDTQRQLYGRNSCLVVTQYNQKDAFSFTIRTYSQVPVSVSCIPPLVTDQWTSIYFKGAWEKSTAGGCSNDLWSFFINPCCRLVIPMPCKVALFLECPKEYSVNIRLFKSPLATPRLLRMGREVLSSGPYRSACADIVCDLEAGVYTAIPSTFRPQELGVFQLCLHCSIPKDSPAAHELKLFPLPTPHTVPPPACFSACVLEGQCTAQGFFGGDVVVAVREPTLLSVRLDVVELTPYDMLFPSMIVLAPRSDCWPHLPSARSRRRAIPEGFTLPVLDHPSAAFATLDPRFQLVKRSDMEGGLSDDGRTTSSAAQDFYLRKGALVLSLLELLPEHAPFVIRVSSIPRVAVTNPKETPTAAHMAAQCAPRGRWRMSLTSDAPVVAIHQM